MPRDSINMSPRWGLPGSFALSAPSCFGSVLRPIPTSRDAARGREDFTEGNEVNEGTGLSLTPLRRTSAWQALAPTQAETMQLNMSNEGNGE